MRQCVLYMFLLSLFAVCELDKVPKIAVRCLCVCVLNSLVWAITFICNEGFLINLNGHHDKKMYCMQDSGQYLKG